MAGEMADWLDILFKIGEIGSIVVGGGLALKHLGQTSAKTAATLEAQNTTMRELKEDIKALNEVVTTVAVQSQRLDQFSERMNTLDRHIDELRRGEGYIRGPRGVDKEYGK
jgi:hypothetical protein